MRKLRGSGNTFSTSGKRWKPFQSNPIAGKRAARLHRALRSGKLKLLTKAEQRELAAKAVAEHGKPLAGS